jgi:DNA mismatch repair protein MutL
VAAVRSLLEPSSTAPPARRPEEPRAPVRARDLGLPGPEQTAFAIPAAGERTALPPIVEEDGPRFLGQAFGVFLIFELPGRLLILDQHAAHERIIFERLSAAAPPKQELLFPLPFDVSEEEEQRLTAGHAELDGLGISMRRAGPRQMEVTALSEDFRALPEEALLDLLREGGGVKGGEWRRTLAAGAACRLAIKEGERVDPVTAVALCRQALDLPGGRCPHGRPIWRELSEDQLLRWVDRPARG